MPPSALDQLSKYFLHDLRTEVIKDGCHVWPGIVPGICTLSWETWGQGVCSPGLSSVKGISPDPPTVLDPIRTKGRLERPCLSHCLGS